MIRPYDLSMSIMDEKYKILSHSKFYSSMFGRSGERWVIVRAPL